MFYNKKNMNVHKKYKDEKMKIKFQKGEEK